MPVLRAAFSAGLAAAALLFNFVTAPDAVAQGTATPAAPSPREIIVATAPIGSPLGQWGTAFVERLKAGGVAVSQAATGGSLPNSALLQTGRVAIGLVSLDTAAAAWIGKSPMGPGLCFGHLRMLAPVAPASVLRFVVPADSGITGVSGLAKKRLALAPDDTLTEPMLKALGVEARLRRMPLADTAKQLADKKIDAVAVTGLDPFALPPQQPFLTIGLTTPEVETVAAAMPGVAPAVVPLPPPPAAPAVAEPPAALEAPAADTPAASSPGDTAAPADPATPAAVPAPAPVVQPPLSPSAGLWTWLVAVDTLPDDVARRATEIAVTDAAALAQAAGLAPEALPDPRANRSVPFHHGATAAWTARGVDLGPEPDPITAPAMPCR